MMSEKKRPGRGELPSQVGKEEGRQNKYSRRRLDPSIPIMRISISRLSEIYRYQHNKVDVGRFTVEEIMALPDSSDMTFGEWFDLCKGWFDIYEESV